MTEMSQEQALEAAQSWLNTEIQKIQREANLTPAQMMGIIFRSTNKYVENYLKSIEDGDER